MKKNTIDLGSEQAFNSLISFLLKEFNCFKNSEALRGAVTTQGYNTWSPMQQVFSAVITDTSWVVIFENDKLRDSFCTKVKEQLVKSEKVVNDIAS